MNENILKEAKYYIEHITSLNTSKAFLRGFICGLKARTGGSGFSVRE